MRLIDVSEYDLKNAQIQWVEYEEHSITLHSKLLYEIPTFDAAPVKHGRWRKTNNPNYSPFDGSSEHLSICSNCAYSREQHDFLYCPNCGAKMDLEEQDAQTEQPGK